MKTSLPALACALTALLLGLGPNAGASAPSATNPLADLVAEAPGATPILGTVQQTLRAGSYTYLEVEPHLEIRQPVWVVVLGVGPDPGERVRVRSFGRRRDFYSHRLGLTFTELVFGIITREA